MVSEGFLEEERFELGVEKQLRVDNFVQKTFFFSSQNESGTSLQSEKR